MSQDLSTPITVHAADGYVLHGRVWRDAAQTAALRPVVIINPATSVRSSYYARFAQFLHHHGCDVVTYDYRGIGDSRPRSLRGFSASWLDWGRLDFEAVLGWASQNFPGQPLQVVAHSVGGVVLGLAPSNHLVSRAFSMGAQFAHWPDYAPEKRITMLLKWHVVMPVLTALLGYFPGRTLGWMEDTPRGVVRDWLATAPRFEDAYRSGPHAMTQAERAKLADGFAAMQGPLLALGVVDDEFGTVPAIQRLLAYFKHSHTVHLQLPPAAIGVPAIGHFAFFHSRFEASLWPLALDWLASQSLRADLQQFVVQPAAACQRAQRCQIQENSHARRDQT
jgi:predicted alpha/beta hydrolase